MRDIKFYIILALLIALVISILTRPIKEITDIKPFEVEIQKRTDQLKVLIEDHRQQQEKILAKFKKDSLAKIAYRNEIKGLQTRLSKRRIRVDSILVDRPEAKEFISMQDSVISMQAGRIDTLENSLSDLRIDIKTLNRNFDLAMEAQVSRYNALEEINKLNEKALRKAKRGNRWLKAAIPAVGVGMFLLAQ